MSSPEITKDLLCQAIKGASSFGLFDKLTKQPDFVEAIYNYLTNTEYGMGIRITDSELVNRLKNTILSNSVLLSQNDDTNSLSFPDKICKYIDMDSPQPFGSDSQPVYESIRLSVKLPSREQMTESVNNLIKSAKLERCYTDVMKNEPEDVTQFFKFFGNECLSYIRELAYDLFPEADKFSDPDLHPDDKERVEQIFFTDFLKEQIRLENYLKDRFGGAPSSVDGDLSNEKESEIPNVPINPIMRKHLIGFLPNISDSGAISVLTIIIVFSLLFLIGVGIFVNKIVYTLEDLKRRFQI
jgi:hypothetical protein